MISNFNIETPFLNDHLQTERHSCQTEIFINYESEENGTLPPTETSHPPSQVLEEEDQGQEQEQGPG